MRLYTYIPKENTVDTDGILSTALTENGFEKYRRRTGKWSKKDVLEALDSWEKDWKRSKGISALTEPIPNDAAKRFREFAKSHKLYSFDTNALAKLKILEHIRLARTKKGGGTDEVSAPSGHYIDWNGKPGSYLFSGIPHYMIQTSEGKIPVDLVREEKTASSKIDIRRLYDDIKLRYKKLGYSIDGDRLLISKQPFFANGSPVPLDIMRPNVSGGDAQDDGTIRINPNYRSVMRHWKLKGSGRDFLNTIIGHELGHHIDRTLLRGTSRSKQELRDRLLDEIRRKRFHTVYTDSYDKATTDPRKLDKELLAEYLSSIVNNNI